MAATQVLLLNDVENLGRKGDVVTTRPGFAYNFLIPQGFALVATPHVLRQQKKLQQERQMIADRDRKEAEEIAAKLNGETVAFTVKVDHDGHMYGSVSAHDIVDLIKMQTGIEIEKRFVQLKHAIKETGVIDLALRLKEGIVATIHVKIIPEHAAE